MSVHAVTKLEKPSVDVVVRFFKCSKTKVSCYALYRRKGASRQFGFSEAYVLKTGVRPTTKSTGGTTNEVLISDLADDGFVCPSCGSGSVRRGDGGRIGVTGCRACNGDSCVGDQNGADIRIGDATRCSLCGVQGVWEESPKEAVEEVIEVLAIEAEGLLLLEDMREKKPKPSAQPRALPRPQPGTYYQPPLADRMRDAWEFVVWLVSWLLRIALIVLVLWGIGTSIVNNVSLGDFDWQSAPFETGPVRD